MRTRRAFHPAIAVGLLILGAAIPRTRAVAEDAACHQSWPQYKYDSARTGNTPHVELHLPLIRVAAWRFPAQIYASPAVAGERVTIQDALGNVGCFNYRTHKVLWTRNIGGLNNRSSPAVAKGRVYVGSTAGYLAILDAATGRILKKIEGPGGVFGSPVLADAAVYFCAWDGVLKKLSLAGDIIWTYDTGGIFLTEFAVRQNEIVIMPAGENNFIHLLDQGDSYVVLERGNDRKRQSCIHSGVCLSEDMVYSVNMGKYGGFAILEAGKSRLIDQPKDFSYREWHTQRFCRSVPSVRGNEVFRGDACFRVIPGFSWRRQFASKPEYKIKYNLFEPVKPVHEDSAYTGAERGKYDRLIKWQTDDCVLYGSHSSPALSRRYQVAGGEDGILYVHALDPEGQYDVSSVWTYETLHAGQPNSAISASAALANGRVFVGGEDGILYVLGEGKETPVVDLDLPRYPEPDRTQRIHDLEWHTAGGGFHNRYVSADKHVKGPFKERWKTVIWGGHKQSGVAADDRVFVASETGSLIALDAHNGRILWRYLDGISQHAKCAPMYYGGKLYRIITYIHSCQDNRGIYCHEPRTGRLLWKQPVKFGYWYKAHGLSIVAAKVLVLEPNEETRYWRARAYAADTGDLLWTRQLDHHADYRYPLDMYGTDIARRRYSNVTDGQRWFVSFGVGDIGRTLCLDPDTGAIIWETDAYHVIETYSLLGYHDDTLVVFGKDAAYALDPRTGILRWKGGQKSRGYRHSLRMIDSYPPSYFAYPLTERFMTSKGQLDHAIAGGCNQNCYINGVWFGHGGDGYVPDSNRPFGIRKVIDRNTDYPPKPYSNGHCPTPMPAYGYLYNTQFEDGVYWCYQNRQENALYCGEIVIGTEAHENTAHAVSEGDSKPTDILSGVQARFYDP